MKLLLDQNLSRRLVKPLAAVWRDTSHVCLHGLEKATDRQLWDFATHHDYCLLSKDSDFMHLALLHGAPPKAIIVKTGNASTDDIYQCLSSCRSTIDAFLKDDQEAVLIIP